MTYKNLFGDDAPAPVATRSNLFGEVKKENVVLKDIEVWVSGKSNIQTKAKRIEFILNGVDVATITPMCINEIGQHTIGESTLASKCIENVVTEFSELKPYLDEPKQCLLSAVTLIEGDSKPKGFKAFLSLLSAEPKMDPAVLRKEVKGWADKSLTLMQNCVRLRLNPFIEGLGDATYTVNDIAKDIDDAVNTLDYVHERSTDPVTKDLALRRKEMFVKSHVLMQLNQSQLQKMTLVCEQNKAFLTELEMNIIPVIENVMRTAVIDGVNGVGLGDIAAKMKGIL